MNVQDITDSIDINDYEVLTHNGWVDIAAINKTVPFDVYELITENNHTLTGADNHIIFCKNFEQKYLKDLTENDEIITIDGLSKVKSIKNLNRQEEMYDLVLGENSTDQSYYTNGILSHNSTIYTVYALHTAMFKPDTAILICANKQAAAVDFLKRIKKAYQMLPNFLKIGVNTWAGTEIAFENGSSIKVSATSPDAARGYSADICFTKDTFIPIIYNKEPIQVAIKELVEFAEFNKKEIIKDIKQTNINVHTDIDTTSLSELINSDVKGFKQIQYHIMYDTTTIPRCAICGKPLTNKFKNGHYPIVCGKKCNKLFEAKYGKEFDDGIYIVSDTGIESFGGISIKQSSDIYKLTTEKFGATYFTGSHKIKINDVWNEVQNIKTNDRINTICEKTECISINKINTKPILVYDLLNVGNTHAFYTNGLCSHNCILDEAAFVPNNIMDEFTESIFPVISSRPNGKLIAVSTPNGMGNWYAKTWHQAIYKLDGNHNSADDSQLNWHPVRFDWWEHPLRDERWKAKQIAMFGGGAEGQKKFRQEFGNFFEASSSTLIDGKILQEIKKDVTNDNATEPIRIDKIHEREINIYEEPLQNHAYVLSIDPSDGTGNDTSVILVGDITDTKKLHIVASFGASDIPPIELGYIASTLGQRYNYAFIIGERNGVGSGVFDTLHDVYEYENIISYGGTDGKMGIMSTNKVKVDACMWAKMFIELYKKNVKCYVPDNNGKYQLTNTPINFRMNDNHIMYELEFFERKPTAAQVTYQAAKNYHDDYVMALVWLLYSLSPKIADNYLNIRSTFMTDFGIEIPEYISLDAAQLNYTQNLGTLEDRLQQYKVRQSSENMPHNNGISDDEFFRMQQMIYGERADNYEEFLNGRYIRRY